MTSNIDPNLPLKEAINQIVMRIAHRGGGYSGGALAAFFLGFNSCVREQETSSELHLDTFVTALEKGTDQCYRYFGEDAKEGTILSVMRACSLAAKQAFEEYPTFRNVLIKAYLAATDELLNPKLQEVEILLKQKFLDAGGSDLHFFSGRYFGLWDYTGSNTFMTVISMCYMKFEAMHITVRGLFIVDNQNLCGVIVLKDVSEGKSLKNCEPNF